MRLQDKVGIITAAGSGMGQAGALRFAKEGAAVAVVDLSEERAQAVVDVIRQEGGTAIAIAGDLRGDDFSKGIVDTAVSAFGRLDFVWNHVGCPGPGEVENLDMADYDKALDINLRSVVVTTGTAIKAFVTQGHGGTLLFTASVAGLQGSRFSPVYSAAKFGVIGYMRSIAKRYAAQGIRANAVCPASVDTPMLREFVSPFDQRTEDVDQEGLVKKIVAASPSGRAAKPAEIANAALFLISDEASFISGVSLPIDGSMLA